MISLIYCKLGNLLCPHPNRVREDILMNEVGTLPFPMVNSPFYKTLLGDKKLSPKELAYVEHYRKYGYVIIEDCIADDTTANRIHLDCESIKKGYGDNRVQDGWKNSAAIKSVATNEVAHSIIKLLYGREPIPVQTLNFLRGTQQRTHSDVIHFSSLPAGFMCGLWTALEDITINQGPLHYYPGSHQLPEFDYYDLGMSEECVYPNNPHEGEQSWDNPRTREKYTLYEDVVERLMQEHGFERQVLTLKRGQALIWSSNLFHGGNPILDENTTRKSQVTHFQFEGTIPWTPMYSNAFIGDYYLQGLYNIRTGEPVERTYNFMPVNLIPMSKPSRYKIGLKTVDASNDVQGFLPQSYLQDLEFARKENAELRQMIEDITQTQLWKTMQPIREMAKLVKGKR